MSKNGEKWIFSPKIIFFRCLKKRRTFLICFNLGQNGSFLIFDKKAKPSFFTPVAKFRAKNEEITMRGFGQNISIFGHFGPK